MQVDLLPNLSYPTLTVQTVYTDAAPVSVERIAATVLSLAGLDPEEVAVLVDRAVDGAGGATRSRPQSFR